MIKYLSAVLCSLVFITTVVAHSTVVRPSVALLKSETATPALWYASKTGATSPLYLFGTFHLLPQHLRWLDGPVLNAVHGSTRLVFELTPKDASGPDAQKLMAAKGQLPAGKSLKAMLDADTYAKIVKQLAGAGLPEASAEHVQPWFAAMLSMIGQVQKQGFDGAEGADRVLQSAIITKSKTVLGLETMAEQIELFAGLDEATQVELLKQTLGDAEMDPKKLAELLDAWKSGADALLDKNMLSELRGYPKLYDRLLKNRNQRWLPMLEAFTKQPGASFVAVGAAHLVGPDGLVALLRADGYKVIKLQPKALKHHKAIQ